MSSIRSLVTPSKQRYVIIHEWATEFCKELGPSARVGAGLISFFSNFHDARLTRRLEAGHISDLENDSDLFQRHDLKYIVDSMLGVGKKDSVISAMKFLKARKVLFSFQDESAIDPHKVPSLYLFDPRPLNEFIIKREQKLLADAGNKPQNSVVDFPTTGVVDFPTTLNNSYSNYPTISIIAKNEKKENEPIEGNPIEEIPTIGQPKESTKKESAAGAASDLIIGPTFPLPYQMTEVKRDLEAYLSVEKNRVDALKLAGRTDLQDSHLAEITEKCWRWVGSNPRKRICSWEELREWFIKKWIRDHQVTVNPTRYQESDLDFSATMTPQAEIFPVKRTFEHMANYLAGQPQLRWMDGIYGDAWNRMISLANNPRKREWLKAAVQKVAKEKRFTQKYFKLEDAILAARAEVLAENNIQSTT